MKQALTLALALGGIAVSAPGDPVVPDVPTLSIGDAVVPEGDGCGGCADSVATFQVTLSGAHHFPVTVAWATQDLTAHENDYVADSNTLRFYDNGPQDIPIQLHGDLDATEGSEVFFVHLTSPQGAMITRATGHGVIADDDFVSPTAKCDLDGVGRSNPLVLYQPPPGLRHSPSHVPFPINATVLTVVPPAPNSAAAHPDVWRLVAADNFDGEAECDLFWEHTNNVHVAKTETEDGVLKAPHNMDILPIAHPGAGWKLLGSGHFNEDGQADLLWWHAATRALLLWKWHGDRLVPYPLSQPSLDHPKEAVAIVDLHGEGSASILWRDPTSGALAYTRVLHLWVQPEVAVASPIGDGDLDVLTEIVGVGDFNGDGTDDLLWQDAGARMSVSFMRGTRHLGSSRLSPERVDVPYYLPARIRGPR